MIYPAPAARRWAAGALLVGLGWLASPGAVPVYDGVGAPDEPYRYVTAPSGAKQTDPPTTAEATTPVAAGRGTNGLSVATREVGPQFSLFLPPQSMAAASGPINVEVVPQAPTDQPAGARIDGNVYVVSLAAPSGPVTLTEKAAISTVYLRATTSKQPPPVLQHRAAAGQPWTALQTSRGGTDFYVAAFAGAGEYAVAFTAGTDGGSGGPSTALLVGIGALVLLGVVVVVVRLRATSE